MFRNCLFVISSILWLTCSPPLAAAEISGSSLPSQALVQEILVWLSDSFDLPAVKVAPTIEFASAARLAMLRKHDGGLATDIRKDPAVPAQDSDIVAVYDRSSETIFLPIGWAGATAAEQSILVHELVHHVQKVAQIRFDCPMAAEKLAYLAQDRWLERFGSSLEGEFQVDRFTIVISTACFH